MTAKTTTYSINEYRVNPNKNSKGMVNLNTKVNTSNMLFIMTAAPYT